MHDDQARCTSHISRLPALDRSVRLANFVIMAYDWKHRSGKSSFCNVYNSIGSSYQHQPHNEGSLNNQYVSSFDPTISQEHPPKSLYPRLLQLPECRVNRIQLGQCKHSTGVIRHECSYPMEAKLTMTPTHELDTDLKQIGPSVSMSEALPFEYSDYSQGSSSGMTMLESWLTAPTSFEEQMPRRPADVKYIDQFCPCMSDRRVGSPIEQVIVGGVARGQEQWNAPHSRPLAVPVDPSNASRHARPPSSFLNDLMSRPLNAQTRPNYPRIVVDDQRRGTLHGPHRILSVMWDRRLQRGQ